jgi:hypothetical protein
MLPLFGKNRTLRRVQMMNLKALPSRDQKITAENAGVAKGEMEPEFLSTVRHLRLSAGYELDRSFPDAGP